MKIEPIKTRKMMPPKDDLWGVLDENIVKWGEGRVLVVTSKVVAIHQGRCIRIGNGRVDRDKLVEWEADLYADRDIVPGQHLMFSIKQNVMIASAGIDKSNADGYLVLWPTGIAEFARKLGEYMKRRFGVSKVGVVITDSHVVMMRRGTMGISLGHYGFNPVRDYVGKGDIFGRKLQVQVTNVVDAIAAASVVVMGEGKEQTPLAVVSDVDWVDFTEDADMMKGEPELIIPLEEDLFEPMLSAVEWRRGRGGLTREDLDKLIEKGKL
jgi:F420-0:gamma-glutamyl ligase